MSKFELTDRSNSSEIISINGYEIIERIGVGSYGRVYKVFKNKKYYVLKEIPLNLSSAAEKINSVQNEADILSSLNNKYVVKFYESFKKNHNIYIIMEYCDNGDLCSFLNRIKKQRKSEEYFLEIDFVWKLFIQMSIGLYYIHSKKIIHRDIKPENLIFDQNGYLHITDFGIAKLITKNNSHETSGTPGYMAPEVMQGLSHTFSVDFYAIGVIIYELMMGKRPYTGKTRKEIKEQIMGKQAKISKLEIPDGWSFEAADFANKLLVRKEVNRLGFYNENNIKEHPWLKDVDMDLIKNKKLKAPFLPKKNHDNYDKNYCEEEEEINIETMNRFEDYKLSKNYKNLFLGFTFYNINNIVVNSNENNDIKNKTLVVYNKKNFNDNKFNSINHNNNYSSEKMNKSLKIIHQRYKSNIPNNINLEKNINMNYSLSKIISRKNDHKLLENIFSPVNNYYIQGYDKKHFKDSKENKEKKSKRSKSFSLNFLKKEKIDNTNNSYMKLLQELNYKNSDNNNKLENENNEINNDMMKLSTNFYLPQSIKKDKKERPKSISNINIGLIMDKNKEIKNIKIKQLNTNKHFYKKKKLNKNYSQGNIQSKNSIKINNLNNHHQSIINEKNYNKSLSKSKMNKTTKINKINKSKTIIRNNSINRNKLNLPQKKIPIPKTSGKKFTRRKLDTKIILNLNENNNFNLTHGTNTTKGKFNFYNKKTINTSNLCKNLLNELSFNSNDNYNRYNIQANYNTINVEDRNNYVREYNKSINTDLLFSLKKVNSFKNLNQNKKGKVGNNSTKLIKNKVKINLNEKPKNNNLNYLNNTNYKFKIQKKINTIYSDNSDNKSQINSKIISFEYNNNVNINNNYNTNVIVNNNRSINNKNRIKSKNILIKGKNAIGNYSYHSAYSTASTGQTKVNNK